VIYLSLSSIATWCERRFQPNSLRSGLSGELLKLLIVSQRDELRVSQVIGAGPFQEFDLGDSSGFS
jgi:hypothetical protein